MPDASGRICHLVANKANAIDSWSRLDLGDGRSGPGFDCRLLLHRRTNRSKGKTRRPTDVEPTVGNIVVLIALGRISLAPDVFMGGDVLAFEVVGGAGILSRGQIAHVHQSSVGYVGMGVTGVIARNVLSVTIRT